MNAPYRSPAITLETDRQWLRRLISSFRHNSWKRPYGTIEYRAAEAADRLDLRAEVRAEIALDAQRPVILDDDEEDHLYTTERNQRQIAREVYHGGEMP